MVITPLSSKVLNEAAWASYCRPTSTPSHMSKIRDCEPPHARHTSPATPEAFARRLRPDRVRRLAGRWKPSILLGKALAAGILNPAAEPVSLLRGQRADLRRIKYAVSSPILLANYDLIACQHGIF